MKQAFLIVKKTIRTIAPIINFLPFLGMCLILQAAMIYACVAFVCNCLGMMNDLIWPLTICILIVIDLSIWLRENKKVPKCEHGIRRGKEISRSTNKLRCPKCQQIAEQQAEERTKKLKLQESINARYNHLLEQAENRRRNAIQADKEKIKSLSPKAFEDLTAALFRRMGYKVKQTPYSNDGGKDAFAEKNGIQYLIECKHYKEDAKISRPLLQKLYAAMNENHIQHGIYVATCSYTQTAIEYGQQFHIELIDISRLLSLLRKYYNPQTDERYEICCKECGEIVTFKLFDDTESKMCSRGHVVANVFCNKVHSNTSSTSPKRRRYRNFRYY